MQVKNIVEHQGWLQEKFDHVSLMLKIFLKKTLMCLVQYFWPPTVANLFPEEYHWCRSCCHLLCPHLSSLFSNPGRTAPEIKIEVCHFIFISMFLYPVCGWMWLTSHNLVLPDSYCTITPFFPFSPGPRVWPMMYAQRQVVNHDLLVVMNGHKALCLPVFAAAETCCSVIPVCVCSREKVYQTEKGVLPKHAIHNFL